jgi:signal transduction histidine kinase
MRKIPFTVSARTARLIGRENIASSKGAIVELVKNCYDADSSIAIIYFKRILETIVEIKTVDGEEVEVEKEVDKSELFIIDSGEGMTEQIIRKHWMTIGTNNKESDFFTKTGRIKAGAKGIGRFALDKLGDKCEMITKFNPDVHEDIDEEGNKTKYTAYQWEVDWRDFEGDFKTIDQVKATLVGSEELDLKDFILNEIEDENINNLILNKSFDHGTIFKISSLRENWEDFFIEQIFNDLEVLIPPKEDNGFQIFLFSNKEPKKYGEVLGSVCDDYDYKVVVKANKNEKVTMKIFRNEYDLETIPPKFFERSSMQEYPYRKVDFKRGKWVHCTSFSELIPGFKSIDKEHVFEKIGEFTFTYYYMKKTYSSPDAKKFFYRSFNSRDRQDWLKKFGGIKLFRDDFRVRPYGEVNDSAFDWLSLGGRKAKNPAPTSHKSGKWKVEPDNISGSINISRIGNVNFEDKSSREGLQENKAFQIFKQLILGVLKVFEKDRAKIAREMFLFDLESNDGTISDIDLNKITNKYLNNKDKSNNTEPDNEKVILAKSIQNKNEQIKQLEEEQKILRGMATSGIVTASFTHELGNLSDVLSSRVEELKELFEETAPESSFIDTPDFLNPYILLEDMQKQDVKLQNWLKFSLSAAKKDKRTRKKIYLNKYFNAFSNAWTNVFENRMIHFEYTLDDEELDMRALEIDFDSIFNNLIVNSIDSFLKQKTNSNRKIKIHAHNTNTKIFIDYFDNGCGLSEDITDHNSIFEALYTTKRHEHTGEEIGTGLGMWLIDTIVKEYEGKIQLLYPDNGGFGLRIKFIRKYSKG